MRRRAIDVLSARHVGASEARVLGMLHGEPAPSVVAVDARPEAGDALSPQAIRAIVERARADGRSSVVLPGHVREIDVTYSFTEKDPNR